MEKWATTGGKLFEFQRQVERLAHFDIWEATEQNGDQSIPRVILWAHHPLLPLEVQAQWKNELAVSEGLPVKGFRRALGMESFNHRLALILEKPAGVSLDALQTGRMNLREILHIAAEVTGLLQVLHQRQIVFNGLSPEHIFWDAATGQATLAGFGRANELGLGVERRHLNISGQLHFRYFSPEQTGRMNRTVDSRSDLYVLGILLYEWLCGVYPFPEEDALSRIHAHLAMAPLPLNRHRQDLPEVMDAIVQKLLAKNPEDRFQSADGLRGDWHRCLESLDRDGHIPFFDPGEEDVPALLKIPEKLYGREAEMREIEALFRQVCNHQQAALMIRGQAGVGKSALVDSLRLSVFREYGIFIQGKFDKLQTDLPYSALLRVLDEAIGFACAQPEEILGGFRAELLELLGENGAFIANLLPGLKNITGTFSTAAELQGMEAENRLNHLLQVLIKALALRFGPLVIMLDDLQWADPASLRFLDLLLSGVAAPRLFLIGAYRENEVQGFHPLLQMMADLEAKGIFVHQIALGPLPAEVVRQMLRDTLARPEAELEELSKLIHLKTEGNPFFINQLLRDLKKQGKIFFDSGRRRWDFDVSEIARTGVPDSAVEFMARKIQELPEFTQVLLFRASCIGVNFALSTLASVSQRSMPAAIKQLMPAISVGLIIPLDENFEILRFMEEDAGEFPEVPFQFVHDRIQEAAYGMIRQEERSLIHYQIAQVLSRHYRNAPEGASELFSVVNHYNQSLAYVWMDEERGQLFELNREAGMLAFHSGAYNAAYAYLSQALRFAPFDQWDRSYEEAHRITMACAESAFLSGEFKIAETLMDEVALKSRTVVDYCRTTVLRISFLVHSGAFERIPDVLFPVLAKLGVRLPRRPGVAYLLLEFFRLWRLERKYPVEGLLEHPPMRDERMVLALDILSKASVFAHSARQELWGVTMLRTISLSLQHGFHPGVIMSLGAYGAMRALLLSDFKRLDRLAQLGYAIAEKHPGPFELSRAYLTMGGTRTFFSGHAAQGVGIWDKCIQTSLAGGDPSFACLVTPLLALRSLSVGVPLDAAENKIKECLALNVQYKEYDMGLSVALTDHGRARLQGKPPGSFRMKGKELDLKEIYHAALESKNRTGFVLGSTGFVQGLIFEGDFEAAENVFSDLQRDQGAMGGTDAVFEFHGWRPVCLSIQYPSAKGAVRVRMRRQIRASIAALEKWANSGPQNFRHRYWLALAEWDRANGRNEEALRRYNKSMLLAREHSYINHLGFVHHRMASLFREMHLEEDALAHAHLAQEAFVRWGADAIAEKLREEFGVGRETGQVQEPGFEQAMDFSTVLKASQAISSEIILEKLEQRLLEIAMENAGAQLGVFLTQQEHGWQIKAFAAIGQAAGASSDISLEERLVPERLIEYVARSRQPLILDQAFTDSRFQQDPYIQKYHPRSVLCMPIIRQNAIKGLLYLENNLVAGAFTYDRIRLLEVLSAQIGISMENATLYRNLLEALDQQKQLAEAYSRFTPREFLQFLGKQSILEVQLGDQRRGIMSVLVSDIRSYTTLTESMSPQENFNFVNSYLQRMTPIIGQHNGVINQFLGDGIIAVFNRPDDAINACLAMSLSLEAYNAGREMKQKAPIRVGIGLHTGPLMLGIIGDSQRMDTAIISDTVNAASRLEGLTKYYFADLIISGQTLQELQQPDAFEFRYLGRVQVKGKKETLQIYEVFNGNSAAQRKLKNATKAVFEAGLQYYAHRQFEKAAASFQEVLQANPDDRTALVFLERISALIEGGIPPDWSDVEIMTFK